MLCICQEARFFLFLHIVLLSKNACKILMGKLEGKKDLGRPRCRWEDNITVDLREIGWGGMD
jgi:hypothetical protein